MLSAVASAGRSGPVQAPASKSPPLWNAIAKLHAGDMSMKMQKGLALCVAALVATNGIMPAAAQPRGRAEGVYRNGYDDGYRDGYRAGYEDGRINRFDRRYGPPPPPPRIA